MQTEFISNSDNIDENKGELEISNVLKWLWEKNQFDILRKLKLFGLYRKRKTFKNWRKNVRESKQLRSKLVKIVKYKKFKINT